MGERARAVFLDRDGTVIEDAHYPRDPERVRLVNGAAEALEQLQKAGFVLIIVSNQSGIGRGLVTQAEATAVHRRFTDVLAERGVQLDGAFYCPHAPGDRCRCRKPSPELLRRAAAQMSIDLKRSFVVGDKPSDIEAGQRAGCTAVLLSAKGDDVKCRSAHAIAESWDGVVSLILGGHSG